MGIYGFVSMYVCVHMCILVCILWMYMQLYAHVCDIYIYIYIYALMCMCIFLISLGWAVKEWRVGNAWKQAGSMDAFVFLCSWL
jgi:hypothetical protein